MAEVLGHFEQAVLLSILRLRENTYGRMILADVQKRLERETAAGAVYATLDRLEAKGLIASRLAEGTPVRAGRPRRYYELTAAGSVALSESRSAHERIWRGLNWRIPAARKV